MPIKNTYYTSWYYTQHIEGVFYFLFFFFSQTCRLDHFCLSDMFPDSSVISKHLFKAASGFFLISLWLSYVDFLLIMNHVFLFLKCLVILICILDIWVISRDSEFSYVPPKRLMVVTVLTDSYLGCIHPPSALAWRLSSASHNHSLEVIQRFRQNMQNLVLPLWDSPF